MAIILGAGNGTRMKSEVSKLLLTIDGKTVLQRSVEAFRCVSDIDEVIITARQQDVEEFANIIDNERVTFVIGGDTRQQSVANAIDTIEDAQLVAIHDGARPLVTPRVIEDTLRAATEYGAAATGIMVKDTIKVIDDDGFVVNTPARSTLFAVQTPQIFDFALYKDALELAKHHNKDFTDDCQLIEYYNKPVKMVVKHFDIK